MASANIARVAKKQVVNVTHHANNNGNQATLTALILGKPGGGKGTISNKILKEFPLFSHVSTGDLLRSHVNEKTAIGVEAKYHMQQGKLVPDDLIIRLLMDHMGEKEKDNASLLLDGFPRTQQQAVSLDDAKEVDLVINLDVPTNVIVDRIADRWIHPASGRIYSYSYKPPKVHGKDDITGEDLIQRDDDHPDKVRNRLEQYDDTTAPLIEYYAEKGILQNFKGTKSDEIYKDVRKWLSVQLDKLNFV